MGATETDVNAELVKNGSVLSGDVLGASVGMMQQARLGLSGQQRHAQGRLREFIAQMVGHGPADDFA
jgi:hypothetical protein